MKKLLLLISAFQLFSFSAFSADNYVETDAYKAGTTTNAVFRATESGGILIPHVIATNADGSPIAGGSGLTDAQLRAAAVPMSAAALPLPSGASTSANQTTLNNSVASIDTKTPALGSAPVSTSQPVNPATTAVTLLQNAATAIGNGTALDTTGLSSIALQTSGSFSAACTFEATIDGSNWLTVYGFIASGTGGPTPVNGSNATGTAYRIPIAGFKQFRARISSYSSGSMTITAVGIADGSSPGTPVIIGNNTSLIDNLGDSNWTTPFSTMASGSGYGMGAAQYVYKSGTTWGKLRTPDTFKTATATASGDTALWTPTSGKKFRLMRYQIQVSADAAQSSGGVIDIVLRDATTGLAAARSVFVPGSAGTAFVPDNAPWIDLGNGILSAAANNVLNINLSAALTTGKVRVVAVGTEE